MRTPPFTLPRTGVGRHSRLRDRALYFAVKGSWRMARAGSSETEKMLTVTTPQMDESWLEAVGDELETEEVQELRAVLVAEVAAGRGFYPPGNLVFNARRLTALDDVRVVILGQDPYHGRGQAMGLCFSVPDGVPAPPSLRNIFMELGTDLDLPQPRNGDLTPWAKRG